jgi:rare lipoprotein A
MTFMVLGLVSLSFSQSPGRKWNGKDSTYIGKATWYGAALQGNLTASGERFDYNKFTAAHKFLPLGSYVKVTNMANGRTLIVKINDRMPLTSSPIIDLTRASAEELDYRRDGVTKVKLEVLSLPQTLPNFWVDMWIGMQAAN